MNNKDHFDYAGVCGSGRDLIDAAMRARLNDRTPCLVDIHLHLDGSLPIATVRRLARMKGVALPQSDDSLRAMLSVPKGSRSLDTFLECFAFPCSLLQTRQALTIAARELLGHLKAQGLIYAEIRFAPQKSCDESLTQREAVEAVLEGMRSVDMPSGLLLVMMRGEGDMPENRETVRLAAEYLGRGVVGVDLAGAESPYPTRNHAALFEEIRARGIPMTVHAGEALGADSVAEALDYGARRIGHGVRSLEDATVVERLVREGVTLELCPTSNIHTGIYRSYEEFPLRELMRRGVKVTLNADDMTVSGITLRGEWERMCLTNHLTRAEMRRLLLNSVDASFAAESTKQTLRHQILDAYPPVYILDIGSITDSECNSLMARLPGWRREKALKYKFAQGRKESIVSFVLLLNALKEEMGIDPSTLPGGVESLVFDYGHHGKPSLQGYPGVHFSISHCRDAVACVVADRPVGIDVESRGRYKHGVAEHVLNDAELAAVYSAADPDEEFLKLWTSKEALLKLTGTGLTDNMKDVLCGCSDKKITTTVCDGYVWSVAGLP